MSYDLVARLTRVLDEDERKARAADGADWAFACLQGTYAVVSTEYLAATAIVAQGRTGDAPQRMMHIARHDPTRTLRVVAAHRRILDLHRPVGYSTPPDTCGRCHETWPCGTVRALAEAYGEPTS